jgi:methionyl-tRNA formyltransferase
MKRGPKIIFMGTPDFAVPALEALHENDCHVVLVVTQPDRPKGRGRKVTPPPVKTAAFQLGYPVIQPTKIKSHDFVDRIVTYEPDLLIVVAFGHILTKNILEIPKLATLNVHASLLPKYRGAAPIQWAILNNEKETGVTTMLMDEGMDTGDILFSSKIDISPQDTAQTLHDRLAVLGADLLVQTLKSIQSQGLNPIPQDPTRVTHAPLLKKSDGHIDWNAPVEKLDCFIRAMTPWPGAFAFHGEKRLKIHKAEPIQTHVDAPPGTVIKRFPDELDIATANGLLSVVEIQESSGKRLMVKDFLRGSPIPPGTVLT